MANNVPALRDRWMAEEEDIGPAACSCDTSTRKMAEIIRIFSRQLTVITIFLLKTFV